MHHRTHRIVNEPERGPSQQVHTYAKRAASWTNKFGEVGAAEHSTTGATTMILGNRRSLRPRTPPAQLYTSQRGRRRARSSCA
eukprot:8384450-Pyramimonas_sp.AAC.1